MDLGDASCKPFSLEQSHQEISTKVGDSLEAGIIPVVLVGDYRMTLPSATAVAQDNGVGKVDRVHFGAHADI